jgi:hypothetical protein
VTALLAAGADADAVSHYRYTPVHLAAMRPESGALAALLAAAPRLDVTDHQGHTPLALAVYCDRHENAAALLAAGADPNAPDELFGRLLSYSANNENVELVSLLLAAGAHPDVKDMWGYTPLARALQTSDFGTAELLLAHGADVGAASQKTALEVVAELSAGWDAPTRSRVARLLRNSLDTQRAAGDSIYDFVRWVGGRCAGGVVQQPGAPVVTRGEGDAHGAVFKTFPVVKLLNDAEPEVMHEITDFERDNNGLVRRDSAQGAPVEVVEVGVSD